MTESRWLPRALVAALLLGIAAWFIFSGDKVRPEAKAGRPSAAVATTPKAPAPAAAVESSPPPLTGESRLADDLNAPEGTIQRDLRILNEVFETWLTNFPRTGNPVGENVEITAALTGANEFRFAFIPPGHRAINARGELCDRWGTPFRFHQLSGQQMEIRSAGPDRRFMTADDAAYSPESVLAR